MLQNLLADNTKEGVLYKPLESLKVRCHACAHRCAIPEGKSGFCRVRFNRGGRLYVPHGYVAGLADDPIEKKPFYHVMPGTNTLSFGMLGCNFHCDFCQNWISSQALRDPEAEAPISKITAKHILQIAVDHDCPIITSTYNEPLISTEWAVEIFQEARKAGLLTAYVSNGHATPEALDYLAPWLDFFKVDLKCFVAKSYQRLGGVLEAVCETIRELHRRGIWVEVVTLLVPGFNDTEEEIRKMAEFLVSVSPDIPWHCTGYYHAYKIESSTQRTSAKTLIRAAGIGKQAGLHYVYAGNRPGEVGDWENTYCHPCGELLVRRFGFKILEDKISRTRGICPNCETRIPGFWTREG